MNDSHFGTSGRTGRALRRTAVLWTLGLIAGAGLLSAGAVQDTDDLGDARATLEKWVETRRVISKEKRDWTLGKEVLEERIALVQRELDSLQERIAAAEGSIQEADVKRDELLAEKTRLAEGAEGLTALLVPLEQRVRALLPRLPDPVRERVKVLSQRLPEDPGATKQSLSERFLNVIGILNEVDKFNQQVHDTSEVRALPGGGSAEVAVLYLGIGQAYYVGAGGTVAGYGTSTAQGWTWIPADSYAAEIERAIATFNGDVAASFVKLPIDISSENEAR